MKLNHLTFDLSDGKCVPTTEMRKILLSIITTICSFVGLYAQTFNLTVINGYGSGNYQVSDTVHIWSVAYDNTKTFAEWTGDTQFLEMPNEWHTTLIMPNQNISVTSVIANMPAYTINYEQIMGKNNLKNVYSYFPPNLKGVIYLFHGTGGNASNWINVVEYRSFINAAIADSFGIIVTEAEEITLNIDLNSDGKLRWHTFPIDTINGIDYLNMKIITDTFVNRGNVTQLTPKISVGMSNGGSFSAAISYIYNYKVGISYCASSAQAIFGVRNNPFAFRMAKYDEHPEVGSQGNYEAWQRDSILNERGICHDYEIHDKQPIYPEEFARITGISVATSQTLFNELINNNQIDNDYYALYSETIKTNILASPSLYPAIIALSNPLKLGVLNQIATSNAEHQFYSDYNFETLNYINNLCSTLPASVQELTNNATISVFPNPTNDLLSIEVNKPISRIEILTTHGQLVKTANTNKVSIQELPNGLYFVKVILNDNNYGIQKIIKE